MRCTQGCLFRSLLAGAATTILVVATIASHAQPSAPEPGVAAAMQSATDVAQAEIAATILRRESALLSQPLSQDDAVDLTLLHSPLAIRLAQTLGLAERDRLRALYEPNPAASRSRAGEETKVQRSQTSHWLSWITPALFAATPENAAETRGNAEMLGTLMFDVRRAWVNAVAALEARTYYEHVAEAAAVARQLAERMRRIGNYAPLDLIREQRFHADALRDLTRAQLAASLARERLAGLLGLWGPTAETMQLPARLPELPLSAIGAETLEALAIAQRVDTQVARHRAAADRDEVAIQARTQLRMAWISYRAAYDLAGHARDALIPLAQRAAAEQQRRYNGMLASVFTLIASAREHVAVANSALDAQREFWLTEVDLQQALAGIGTPNVGSRVSAPMMSSDHGPAHSH